MKKIDDFTQSDFLTEKCKISDMILCSKEDFLKSYNFLTEEEYNNTYIRLIKKLNLDDDEYTDIMFEIKDSWGKKNPFLYKQICLHLIDKEYFKLLNNK